jgi:genome maintenance exonuclease 1
MSKNNGNSYLIEGIEYPRVTTILGVLNRPGLNHWRENVGRDAADEAVETARDIGTVTHEYISRILKGWSFNDNAATRFEWNQLAPEVKNTLQCWESFRLTIKPKIKATELLLVSKEHGYAGTTDCVATVGGLEIIDWKTANALWPEVKFQLAAYAHAYYEMTGKMPVRGRAVRLDKNRTFWTPADQVVVEDLNFWFKGFLGLFDAYKCLTKDGK